MVSIADLRAFVARCEVRGITEAQLTVLGATTASEGHFCYDLSSDQEGVAQIKVELPSDSTSFHEIRKENWQRSL